MADKTLAAALTEACEAKAAKALYYYTEGGPWLTLSYTDFLRRGRAAAALLQSRGIGAGDRVAICAENSPWWSVAYFGLMLTDAVAVPIDAKLTTPEIANILDDSGARLIVHSPQTSEVVSGALMGRSVAAMTIDEVRTAPDAMPKPTGAATTGDDIASLLYTSGTTGAPKAVMLTHSNFIKDLDGFFAVGLLQPTDNMVSVLPFHHTYGFMGGFMAPALLGASATLPAAIKGPEIARASKECGGTVLPAVPQLLELMRNRIFERLGGLPWPLGKLMMALVRFSGRVRRAAGINLFRIILKPLGPKFRLFASGGARLDPQVMLDMEALGMTVVEGYGLTETSPIACFNPLKDRRPGSVGRPIPNGEVKIIDASESGEGEVAIKGPMVMKGYFRREAETAEVLRDGWFLSGDLGRIDADGYLYLTGRKKEVIVLSSGKNIYPEEVERHYAKCALIKELCVVDHEDRLIAVVVPDAEALKARNIANAREAITWEVNALSAALPPHMRVMGIELSLEPLPRTPLMKLRRFKVKESVASRRRVQLTGRKPDPVLMADEAGRAVAEALKPLLPEGSVVHGADNIELDLGLDSLTRLELASALERELNIKLTGEALAKAHTVGELADAVRAAESGGDNNAAESGDDLFSEPSPEDIAKLGLSVEPKAHPLGFMLIGLIKIFFKAGYRISIEGIENLPKAPYILAPNHTSYFDAFAVAAALPSSLFKHMYTVGVEKYFRNAAGRSLARIGHVIPIDPDAHLSRAMGLSAHALRQGRVLLIFPEGGRSFDGHPMAYKKGIGILAHKLGVPVVPVKITGAYEALPRDARWPKPGRITVTLGRPVTAADTPEGHGDRYQRFADFLRERTIEMRAGR